MPHNTDNEDVDYSQNREPEYKITFIHSINKSDKLLAWMKVDSNDEILIILTKEGKAVIRIEEEPDDN